MKSECYLKSQKVVGQYKKNETKCMICENFVFKICRITSELVMLTCENCGETHMIGLKSDEGENSFTFWSQEAKIEA